jgi:hypothetical protein
MSKDKKVSVVQSADRLAIHLGTLGPKRRALLVRGPKNERELNKFLRGIKVPSDLIPEMTGSMISYTNLELTIPTGESFYAVETLGSADVGWKVVADAAMAAGYAIADVRDLQVLLHGHEDRPIPVAACTGVLHNVYANSV